MTRNSSCLFLFLIFAIGAPLAVFAHENEESYEAPSGSYTVDVGYTTRAPVNGEAMQFDFKLRKGEQEVPFSDVWVNITAADGTSVFAGGLYNAPFGGPHLNYAFPSAGRYTVSVRYEQASTTLAEGNFPMTVSESGGESGVPLYAAAGFMVGVLGTLFLILRRRAI